MSIRPDWRTIQRRHITLRPSALAARGGDCPGCGAQVVEDEPIVCVGSAIERGEVRKVDLESAEWVCQRCGVGGAAA